MEVLNHAEELFDTDPQRTYLTGHSMGGHGSWYLGATYPDRFAAIGPAAGYPDLLGYRDGFRRRLETATDEDLKKIGQYSKIKNSALEICFVVFENTIRTRSTPARAVIVI